MVCFRLSPSQVRYKTQNHMGYSEFNNITPAIARTDAGVISIKISRAVVELLTAFGDFECPNELGRGLGNPLPRVPPEEVMITLLQKAASVIPPEWLWVNPDYRQKTRNRAETAASLKILVTATKTCAKSS